MIFTDASCISWKIWQGTYRHLKIIQKKMWKFSSKMLCPVDKLTYTIPISFYKTVAWHCYFYLCFPSAFFRICLCTVSCFILLLFLDLCDQVFQKFWITPVHLYRMYFMCLFFPSDTIFCSWLALNDFAPTDLWTMNFIYTVYEIYFPVTVKFTGKTCDFNKFLN